MGGFQVLQRRRGKRRGAQHSASEDGRFHFLSEERKRSYVYSISWYVG